MEITVLRKGLEWRCRSDRAVVEHFQLIAEQHGSQAQWLPQTGVLATDDPNEIEKNFPYDDWRRVAEADVLTFDVQSMACHRRVAGAG